MMIESTWKAVWLKRSNAKMRSTSPSSDLCRHDSGRDVLLRPSPVPHAAWGPVPLHAAVDLGVPHRVWAGLAHDGLEKMRSRPLSESVSDHTLPPH